MKKNGQTTLQGTALKFIDVSLRAINDKKNRRIRINGNSYFPLQKQDMENIIIGRLVYNYEDQVSEIIAIFNNGFKVTCYLDPIEDLIYTDYIGDGCPE